MSEETEIIEEVEEVEEVFVEAPTGPAGEVFVCNLCGIKKNEPLKDKKYCENCSDNLHQAYQWMQSPMLTTAELKKLNDRIMELTDIDSIVFED
jgi:hypothetical protein